MEPRQYRSLLDQARDAIGRELPELGGVRARRAARAATDAVLRELGLFVIALRPATAEDAEMLRHWRNDPETRAASNRTREMQPAEWADEIEAKIANETLLIAEINGTQVGTAGIKGNELSWTVAPERRGRGIGKAIVAAVAKPGHVAHIRRANLPSQRIAAAAGFTLAEDGEMQLWIKRR